jgi:hypothetical protein
MGHALQPRVSKGTVAPVPTTGTLGTYDGPGRPARQASVSPQARRAVVLAPESAQRDSRYQARAAAAHAVGDLPVFPTSCEFSIFA